MFKVFGIFFFAVCLIYNVSAGEFWLLPQDTLDIVSVVVIWKHENRSDRVVVVWSGLGI